MISGSRRSPIKPWVRLILLVAIFAGATLIGRSSLPAVPTPRLAKASNNVTIWLNGDAAGPIGTMPGWNDSKPGPSLILDSGVTVHLLLNATDGLLHDWFIDTRSNFSPDPNGITSPDFSHSTTNVLNFTFTPIIGQNVPTAGNWTYRCMYHPTVMFGTVKIVQPSDFSLSTAPTISTIAGSLQMTTITVNPIASFTGTVNLTVTAPSGLRVTLSPARVTTSGSSTLTVSSVVAGNYTVIVTGTNGTITHAANILVTVADFAIATDSTIESVNVNASISSTVRVTSVNHFGNPITWSANDTECTINPVRTTLPANPDLSCKFSQSGIFHITITGTSGTLSHSSTVTFDVSRSAQPSGSTTPWLTIAAIGGSIAAIVAVAVSYAIIKIRKKPCGARNA